MSAVREVAQEFPTWIQNYKEPANKAKADSQLKALFAYAALFNDRTRQPSSQQISQSVTNLTKALEAFKDVSPSRIAPVVSLAARMPILSKVIPESIKVTSSLRADKARLEALLATANREKALFEQECNGIENRQVVLPLQSEELSTEMLLSKIDPSLLEESEITDLRTLVSWANEDASRFQAMAAAFVKHCQGYTHKDKSVYFTPQEVADKRQLSLVDDKVQFTTEYALKRRVDGDTFATIQAVYDGKECKFHSINLLAVANRADVQKFNRVSNKVEAASGASI